MLFQQFYRARYTMLALVLLAGCASEGNRDPADASVLSSGAPSSSSPVSVPVSSAPPPSGINGASLADAAEQTRSSREGSNAVFFQRGSAVLDDTALAVLRRHAESLRENPRLVVTLVGHTDHLGSRSYNLAIAEQRTAVVKAKLREFGVAKKQMRARSYGYEQPGVSCTGEACRRNMRRVDLLYPEPRMEHRVGELKR